MAKAHQRHAKTWLLAMSSLAAAAVASVTLATPWHEVHTTSVGNPSSILGALYVGPDYLVSGADRAALLETGLTQTTELCTGLDHIDAGVLPLVLLAGVFLCVVLAASRRGRASVRFAAAACLCTAATTAVALHGSFLRHVVDDISAQTAGASAFRLGLGVLALTSGGLLWTRLAARDRHAAER